MVIILDCVHMVFVNIVVKGMFILSCYVLCKL
jgi:hypothetical protein